MEARTVQKNTLILALCTFLVTLTGLFLFDGTVHNALALTTPDCRVCHTGGPNYASTFERHHSIIRACAACHGAVIDVYVPNEGDLDCLNCHYFGTTVYRAVDVTTAHAPLHDMTDVPDPATCVVACHLPGVIDEHTKYPTFAAPSGEIDCDRCHLNTNTDPLLGPINVQEMIVIGSSTAVTPEVVTCEKCHTTIGDTGHAAAHDNVLPNAGCNAVGCHNSNVMLEHTDRGWACGTCHGSTTVIPDTGASLSPQEVIDAAAGPYDPSSTKFCTDCHGSDAGSHAALHDQVSFLMNPSTQDACYSCHEVTDPTIDRNGANVVAEHITNQGLTCSTCHDGFDYSIPDPTTGDPIYYVIETIEKGRTSPGFPGQPVYCIDCHRNDTLGQGEGHAPIRDEAEPWNRCGLCHILTALGNDINLHNIHKNAAESIEQDCSVCHVPQGTRPNCALCHSSDNWNNTGINLDVIGPGSEDHDFHTSPTGPFYNNGNPLCEGCHVSGVPGAEPLPVPYSECSNCHSATGPGSDIAYGSSIHTVNHIQGAEALGQGCSYCHSPTPACTDCHDIAGPNMPNHDTHTDTLQYNCTECHINGIAGSEPLPAPFNECSTCHSPAGPGSDIVYGSLIHTDNHIAGGEASGQSCALCHGPAAPDCSSCHAPGHPPIPSPYNECSVCHNGTDGTTNIMFGEVGHNIHMIQANNDCTVCHNAQPDCSACHSPGHPAIPAPYNECDQCHTTLQPGQVTHDTHRLQASQDCTVCHTAQPNCGQCHTAGDHASAHDNAGVPSPGCTNCHDANVVVEHVTNRSFTCETCHDSTAVNVINAISAGKAGTFVACYDCHGQNNHHATAESQSGNCTYCHADPRLEVDQNAPTGQLACRECHGSNQHNNGGPIQDFGACFACHQPEPYHAKPTSWPGWYQENGDAPGRGSFNLFQNEFRPDCGRRGDCEDSSYGGRSWEDRSGYGEDGRPSRDRGRNWESPSISFTMVTFYDHFNTKREWTVPTFGTGGGGGETPPPPSNDSVNITRAEYSSSRDRLTVYAENSLGDNATLSVKYDGRDYEMYWDSGDDRWEININSSRCNDSSIEVVSSAGGSDSSSVSNCSSSSWGW